MNSAWWLLRALAPTSQASILCASLCRLVLRELPVGGVDGWEYSTLRTGAGYSLAEATLPVGASHEGIPVPEAASSLVEQALSILSCLGESIAPLWPLVLIPRVSVALNKDFAQLIQNHLSPSVMLCLHLKPDLESVALEGSPEQLRLVGALELFTLLRPSHTLACDHLEMARFVSFLMRCRWRASILKSAFSPHARDSQHRREEWGQVADCCYWNAMLPFRCAKRRFNLPPYLA